MVRISDRQVLTFLEQDGRIPAARIAEELGVTETAIRKRMKKLEAKGIIKQYTIEVDPKKVGQNVVAMVGIDTTPERYMYIVELLKEREEVRNGYTASGNHMIHLECWFETHDEFRQFLREIESINGTTKITPGVILEKFK